MDDIKQKIEGTLKHYGPQTYEELMPKLHEIYEFKQLTVDIALMKMINEGTVKKDGRLFIYTGDHK